MSKDTVRWYRQKLSSFLDFLNDREDEPTLSSLTPEVVRDFVALVQTAGRTAFTTRGYIQVLKGLGTWLAEEGYVAVSPLQRLRLPKVPKYLVKPLSHSEVGALLSAIKSRSAAGARDLAVLLMLLDTGMRLGEMARLTLRDADEAIRDGVFKVMGKGSRERYLPLGKAARDALRRYVQVYRPEVRTDALFLGRDHRPLTTEGFRQIVRRVSSRAGVGGVHPHRLRHTFAVNYLVNGGDAMSLQRILGHSTLEMVRNYVALDMRDIKAKHVEASPGDRFWAERAGSRTSHQLR
ncbi:MAG: tyrosine-type recombinase/integrase [Chloroflexi bacterium]|nr:tyrosine-type recombinase/integrase [Chloroflexota bacterium]